MRRRRYIEKKKYMLSYIKVNKTQVIALYKEQSKAKQ